MTTMRRFAWGAAVAAALSVTLAAQQAPTGLHTFSCVKVQPGKTAEFHQVLNGDLAKLEQARADSGTITAWLALETEIPSGREAPCDYLMVTFYPGWPTAPMSDEEMSAALQKAGIAKTPQEFGNTLMDMGYLETNGMLENVDLVGGAHKGDYVVINSFSVTNYSDWVAAEKKLWQPLAESMVKDGTLSGWAINVPAFPRAAKDQLASTVDIFPSYDAFVQAYQNYSSHWKEANPNVTMQDAFEQFGKLATMEHQVLYKVEVMAVSSK